MVIVIDFDGTLALGDTKDISLMVPNLKLVSLINSLYDDGNTIKIVTARGCKSCVTFEERSLKYFDIITNWLSNNNVKYHELSFFKEGADIYIDDRGINIKNTMKIPLTICSIGLINFSETLEILSKIFDDKSSLLSVRKKS